MGHQVRTSPLLNAKKRKVSFNFQKNPIRIISFKLFLSSKLLLPYLNEEVPNPPPLAVKFLREICPWTP